MREPLSHQLHENTLLSPVSSFGITSRALYICTHLSDDKTEIKSKRVRQLASIYNYNLFLQIYGIISIKK